MPLAGNDLFSSVLVRSAAAFQESLQCLPPEQEQGLHMTHTHTHTLASK